MRGDVPHTSAALLYTPSVVTPVPFCTLASLLTPHVGTMSILRALAVVSATTPLSSPFMCLMFP